MAFLCRYLFTWQVQIVTNWLISLIIFPLKQVQLHTLGSDWICGNPLTTCKCLQALCDGCCTEPCSRCLQPGYRGAKFMMMLKVRHLYIYAVINQMKTCEMHLKRYELSQLYLMPKVKFKATHDSSGTEATGLWVRQQTEFGSTSFCVYSNV